MKSLPRFLVAALVFIRKNDSILLVKQTDGGRYWSLPGGVVEYGESPDQAAVREVKEETGLDIRVLRLVGMYSKLEEKAIALTFEAEIVGGNLKKRTNETSDCRYFPLDQIPEPVREHLYERVEDFKRGSSHVTIRIQ